MFHTPTYPHPASESRAQRALVAALALGALLILDYVAGLVELAPGIAIWSPSIGLSVALLAALGVRMLPPICAASLLSALLIGGQSLDAPLIGRMALEALLYLLVAIVIQRSIRSHSLESMVGIARVVAAGMVLPLPIGLILYGVMHPSVPPTSVAYLTGALERWLRDSIGIVVITPFMLLYGIPWLVSRMRHAPPSPARPMHAAALLEQLLQLLALGSVFWGVFFSPLSVHRPFYLFFLPLIWITLSQGIGGALITILAISFGSIISFAMPIFDHDLLIDVQLFLLANALTGIVLGALVREQTRIARALQESEARANDILHDQIDLVCRYRLDTSLTFVNEAYTRFFGRSAEDLIGTSFLPLTRSEYHSVIERQITEVIQTRQPFVDESTILRCDGSLRWMQWMNHAVVDAQGEVTEIQVVGRDITERRRAEEAYRSLVDQSNQGLTLIRGLQPLFVNPALCEMLGYTRDELLTLPQLLDLVIPEDRARLIAEVIDVSPQHWNGRTYEVQIVRKDGERRWIEVHLAATEHEGMPATMVMMVDVQARKAAEAALELAEQQRVAIERRLQETQKLESLGLLAGGIAHDFNNLLVGVMGNAGLALVELPPGSSAAESIRQIEVAAKHAADLTRQLLAYAGKGSISIRKIAVDELIEEMIQLLRLGVPREIALRSRLSLEGLVVEGDISQLRQVLMNIVINAAEAIGPRPGAITIATRSCWIGAHELRDLSIRTEVAEGRYVAIDVTDTGSGMDEATQQRIFEPFFTTKISGRGLGLAAVIGIVCAHRGALRIRSAPGAGSTFTVLLPSVPTALVDLEDLAADRAAAR